MEAISQVDSQVFLWINGWIGTSATFDRVIHWVVSDYLVPVVCSLTLLGLWFAWRNGEMRERHQRGVMLAGVGVGLASAMVKASNLVFFRHRPFDSYEIEMLFYPPTDSSFPANPVAVVVAMATGVWMANRRIGAAMYAAAFVYGFSRVYAGVFYPLDVLGGALFGAAGVGLAYLLLRRIEPLPTLALRVARFLCVA
ncbi:MAG: phosphatase PAP2 family protein [Chloroflexota bacterium]|nr:phosphatase PAP2 family protein [Chloroflexota bacterium]MDE2942233.1 phosphatase PAP2 family protein [Chloroflexota bacterium]MDE3267700.1 phosphatase PAP2 family protein [Chloroflexota bacterium]